MKFKILIDNVDCTQYVVLPLNYRKTLDSSLDIGMLCLKAMDTEKEIKPLTDVEIRIIDDWGNEQVEYMYVATDVVTEVISYGNLKRLRRVSRPEIDNVKKKYNHDVSLIEQTKWLERFTGIVKTNTKPYLKDYSEAQRYIDIFRTNGVGNNPTKVDSTSTFSGKYANIKSPYLEKILLIPSGNEFLGFMQSNIPGNSVFKELKVYYNGVLYEEVLENEPDKSLEIDVENQKGNWDFLYHFKVRTGSQVVTFLKYSLTSEYVENIDAEKYTITKVVNNLLETAICLNGQETPMFRLNDEQAVEFDKIESPDFSLIGTLWECLSEIGSYLHAIPRLRNNVIYFDKLGSTTKTMANLKQYCSQTSQFDIEQYATMLDSVAQNMTFIDDANQGVIVEPSNNAYKTLRTETGNVLLNTDNCYIETQYPIESIVKLECGYLKNGTLVGDITPYVFEASEYESMSSFDGDYPTAREVAIYFEKGKNGIKGLTYKSPNAIHPVFSKMAILNIIERKLGVSVDGGENVFNLQFRLTYIPDISARVLMSKQTINDIGKISMLNYNQSVNKLNSYAYGENMKGVIAMLGNPTISKMYIMNDLTQIPKVGDLFNDEYYISVVSVEMFNNLFKLEIGLSKDFNKLNEYVGIKNEKRYSEISEEQAYDRYVDYYDYCVINDKVETNYSKCLITAQALSEFALSFSNPYASLNEVSLIAFKGTSNIQSNLETGLLSINSLGVGNSIIFSMRFDDNYSFGNTRKVINGSELQYQSKGVDVYGKIDKFKFELLSAPTQFIENYNESVRIGNKLPIYDDAFNQNFGIRTLFSSHIVDDIKLLKDNREIINFTYQINFVGKDSSYVLGSSLAQKNVFVTDKVVQKYSVYILDYKLDRLAKKIDYTRATLVKDNPYADAKNTTQSVKFNTIKANVKGKAWALVTDSGELVFGRNIDLNVDDNIDIALMFMHRI